MPSISWSPRVWYLFLCLAAKANPSTNGEITLRVENCVSTGSWRNVYVWRNKSAARLGLESAISLFDQWKQHDENRTQGLGHGSEPIHRNPTECESKERILISRIVGGKWKNEFSVVISANRLDTWKAGDNQNAYIFSVLTPGETRLGGL
jgi:hypothetical protein